MPFELLSLDGDALRLVLSDLELDELRHVGATCKPLRVLVAPAILCRMGWERAYTTLRRRARTLPEVMSRDQLMDAHPELLEIYQNMLRRGFPRRQELFLDLLQDIDALKQQLATQPLPLTRRLRVEHQALLNKLAATDVETPMLGMHALAYEFDLGVAWQ